MYKIIMNTNQTKDLNSIIEEKIKEFDKNYCEFTDQGTLIIPIGENGIPIEDFIRQSLTEIVKEALEAVEIGKIEDDFAQDLQKVVGWNYAVSEQKSKSNKFLNK